MMKSKLRLLDYWLLCAATSLVLLPAVYAHGQAEPGVLPEGAAPAKPHTDGAGKSGTTAKPASPNAPTVATGAPAATVANRAQAYYHLALANAYEEDAVSLGRPELVTQAIEEYKLALNADPGSSQLNDGLADLYFRTGHTHDAEATARILLKNSPNDIDAHKLLGKIYLRQLSDGSTAVSSASPSGNALDLAIAEFEQIVTLTPKSVEDRMVLGQLYTVKHDPKKAEEEFKTAQAIEPESEDVVLNLARVYAESGDLDHAVKVIEAVPADARSPRMEVALGAAYDQLKRPKDAIAAYQRATELDPSDEHTLDALGQALLNDNQLDEALKQYKALAAADPEDAGPLVHIGEIERRQGKYEDALAIIRKARKIDPTSLEAGYNEGLLLDVLGRYDEAAQVYEKMVDQTSHANGAYKDEEKTNRGIFLDRLGAIYHEQNKTDQAIATYQKMIDMGGETALRGYQGEVDAYRDAKQFDKAIEVSRKAVEADPKNKDFKLMLAGELADQGKPDEGLAMARAQLDNTDNDRTVWLAIGQMDIRLKRWKDAEDAFNKAGTMTTKTEDRTYLLFLRGELADRQKHYEPAEQFFRQALEVDPNSSMTMNYLGYMMADKGIKLTEALSLIRKAVELEPMNGAYLDSLGWVYFKLGQYELAEENLRQAVERDQTDPTVHDHLGDLYEKTGRIRLAAAQWELSLSESAKSLAADVEPGDVAKVQHKLDNAKVKLAKQESATGLGKVE
jgi:tetratricopeptide (TPR) repeat protein